MEFLQLKSPVIKTKDLLSLKYLVKVPQITEGNYQVTSCSYKYKLLPLREKSLESMEVAESKNASDKQIRS